LVAKYAADFTEFAHYTGSNQAPGVKQRRVIAPLQTNLNLARFAANGCDKLERFLQPIRQWLFQIDRYLRFDEWQRVPRVILGVRSNDNRIHGAGHFMSHQGWVMKCFHSANIKFILSGHHRGLYIVADCYDLMTLVLNYGGMRLADAANAKYAVFISFAHSNSPAAGDGYKN
jgi:hypothetical protein